MIAIINQNKKNKKGETLYHLKINHEFICDFYHNRSEGLSACLIQAARMVMLRRHMEGLINTPKEKEIQAGDILFG